jgi:hypothetical protein
MIGLAFAMSGLSLTFLFAYVCSLARMNQGNMLKIKRIYIILYKSKIYIFPIKIRSLENQKKI